MNFDGNEVEIFINYNKENDVEEVVRKINQTTNDENEEQLEIEIVEEEVDNSIDENCAII